MLSLTHHDIVLQAPMLRWFGALGYALAPSKSARMAV